LDGLGRRKVQKVHEKTTLQVLWSKVRKVENLGGNGCIKIKSEEGGRLKYGGGGPTNVKGSSAGCGVVLGRENVPPK